MPLHDLGAAPPFPFFYGAAPPANPADGSIWVLPADTTNGIMWMLRYNAASASGNKWEFVGGSPLLSYVGTDESTSSTTYVDPTTVQSLTVPRAGDYIVTFNVRGRFISGSTDPLTISIKLGAAATSDTNSIANSASNIPPAGQTYRKQVVALAALDVVKLQFKVNQGTSAMAYRHLEIVPVRVT